MTPIPDDKRRAMLAVRFCGPRVISRLESIGISQLADLADRDPYQLVHEINIIAGRPIWQPPIATQAMANLIAAAQREAPPTPAAPGRRPLRQRSRVSLRGNSRS